MTPAPDDTQAFVAAEYAPRADAYVESPVHAAGADLDRIAGLLAGRADAEVLDLGCGGGHVAYTAAPHVRRVIACDITATMLDAVARTAATRGLRNIETCEAAAEALPFPDASFDVVLSRMSAHHWSDLPAGLRQCRRVLKPGGLAVLIDIVSPADPLLDSHLQAVELLRDASHVRDYSIAEWISALGAAGLKTTTLSTHRLRMVFASWIARTRTTAEDAAAVRRLQRRAPARVTRHFRIDDDGGFDLDVAIFELIGA